MRNRTRALDSRTLRVDGNTQYTRRDDSNPPYVETTNTPSVFDETVFSGTQVTNDLVTPGFKGLSAKGFVINNPYDSTVTSTQMGTVTYDQDYGYHTSGYTWVGHYYHTNKCIDISTIYNVPGHLSIPDGGDLDSLKSRAIAKAWARTVEAPMQSGVTAAEMHKTVRMIAGFVLSAIKLLQRFRNKQRLLRRGGLTALQLANAWLQLRYGLRPLMYEIVSAIDAYNALGNQRRNRYTATVTDVDESQDTQSWNAGTANCPWDYEMERVSTRTYTVRAGVLTREYGDKITIGKAFGLGFDQAYLTAWELVPYSFVIDWFVNIVDLLAAWSPQVHAEVLTSWVVVLREDVQSRRIVSSERGQVYFSDPGWIWESPTITTIKDSVPNEVKTTYKERIPQPDRPVIPSSNVRLNVTKLIDILALLYQLTVR